MAAQAGAIIYASDVANAPGRLVRWGNRTSAKVMTSVVQGTEQGMLRVDSVPLEGGKIYRIEATGLRGDSALDTDLLAGAIRYTSSGTATTSSTEIAKAEQSDQRSFVLAGVLPVTTSGTYSFLVTVRRALGGGNQTVTFYGEPSLNLNIIDMGLNPGDSGVDV